MSDIERMARELLDTEIQGEDRDTYYAAISMISRLLTPPEGYVLVPLEPTEAMINAAEEAHMPFGDMWLAIQAAISERPEAK